MSSWNVVGLDLEEVTNPYPCQKLARRMAQMHIAAAQRQLDMAKS